MSSEREWISISDLMSALMMVFLFIAILFMLKVEDDKQQLQKQHTAMKSVATAYDQMRHNLHRHLQATFSDDLKRWNAEVLPSGAIRFNHPDILFNVGDSELRDEFKEILSHFFPRYVNLLSAPPWRHEVDEIRIEGHTSSDWLGDRDEAARYIDNAQLSQARSFAVLRYVYSLPAVVPQRPWLQGVLRASGLSYSQPIVVNGVEDAGRSRRVEFHIRTRANEKLYDILQHSQNNIVIPPSGQ